MYIWIYVQQTQWKGGGEWELVAGVPSRQSRDGQRIYQTTFPGPQEFIRRPSGVALKILFDNLSLSTLAIGMDRARDVSPFPRWVTRTQFLRSWRWRQYIAPKRRQHDSGTELTFPNVFMFCVVFLLVFPAYFHSYPELYLSQFTAHFRQSGTLTHSHTHTHTHTHTHRYKTLKVQFFH
jgi:hypothetical protein